jgi:hypothetical protein
VTPFARLTIAVWTHLSQPGSPSWAALFPRLTSLIERVRFQPFDCNVTVSDDAIAQYFRGSGGFRGVLFLARIPPRKRKRNAQKEFFHWCVFGDRITRDRPPVGKDPRAPVCGSGS